MLRRWRMPTSTFRWGAPAVVGGLPARLVVAIGYPSRLADLPESETDADLAACDDLVMAYRYFGEAWGEEITGSVGTLVEVLRDYWVQSVNGIGIAETVKRAASATEDAGDILARLESQGSGEQDGPATKALIWLNAMLFQELLSPLLTLGQDHHKHRCSSPIHWAYQRGFPRMRLNQRSCPSSPQRVKVYKNGFLCGAVGI